MKFSRPYRFLAAGILIGVLSAGCAAEKMRASAAPDSPAGKVFAHIKPLVEKLYLNTKELEQIHLDLRAVTNAHAFLPDDLQLNYLQKTALYIAHANLIASQQWEFLSIMEDIKPEALIDYYTLRRKALVRAENQTLYDVQFLELYQSSITSVEAKADIQKSLAILNDIRTIYSQLIQAVAPLARQGLPTSL